MTHSFLAEIDSLCLVTAVEVEFNAAASLLSSKLLPADSSIKSCRGMIGQRRVTLLQCGMGAPRFAQSLSNHLKKNHYGALLIAGLAGGLAPNVNSGDVVIYDRCHDGRRDLDLPGSKEKSSGRDENASIRCDDGFSEFLLDLVGLSGQPSHRGSGVTVRRIITRAEDKLSLGAAYQAAAVDMESYEVLAACAAGPPAAVLRVISDEAGSDLPDFNFAAEADGRMNPVRMAMAMAARPAATFRFLRSIRVVLNTLRASLEVVLNV